MLFNIVNSNRAHFVLSGILSLVISYFLVQVVLGSHYSEKQLYHSAEIRAVNVAGVRTNDFLLKLEDQEFLIAPNIPKKLKARIELSDSGRFSLVVKAQYPHWLCASKDIDKATVLIQGGSLNETVRLISNKPQELKFVAAKGQKISFSVKNFKNKKCGRATITFYQERNLLLIQAGLLLLWVCVLALCLFSVSSPYIVTLGLLANTLLLAAQASLGEITTASVMVNTGLSLGFAGALFFVSLIPFRSKLLALLIMFGVVVILSPALAFIAYEQVFSTPFSMEAVHGVLQSYGSQTLEFWVEFVGIKRTIYLLIALFFLYFCVFNINQARAIKSNALVFGLMFLLIGSALSIGRFHHSGIYNLLLKSIVVYKWEISAYEKVANLRNNTTAQALREIDHSNDTTVIVIGESVNKKYMSAYGSLRQTTPFLDKRVDNEEVVLFTNAYSNHTHSNPTMSLLLTQADQYNGKYWQESPSVFNYASAAGIETHWLTNHRLLGGWSNNITTIVSEADRLKTINYKIGYGSQSTGFDAELIPLFKKSIEERPSQLTLLHLYNSHASYCNRFPGDFNQFDSDFSSIDFGLLLNHSPNHSRMINCYDNTIYYTDQVLEQLITELDERKNPSVLLYVADHAEEVLGGLGHNSAIFTFDMINVPLIVWANKAWRNKHSDLWTALYDNKNKVVTNDHIFESVLGLAGITASSIDVTNDVSSSRYIEPSNPLTLHGRIRIKHPLNWNYWQRHNVEHAKNNSLKLQAVNIESIGEAKAAFALGIKKFQINTDISSQGTIMLVAKNSSDFIAPVDDFISGLEQQGLASTALTIMANSNVDITQVRELVSDLDKQTLIQIELALENQKKPISLAAQDFAKQVSSISNENDTIPVTLSSRYTMPAPEPK